MLQAKNISLMRNECFLLKRWSNELLSGDIVFLLGENGSGKSTLLQALAGLNKPYNGEIICAEKILYLGHGAGVNPYLSAYENLLFAAQLYHNHEEKNAKELIEIAGEKMNLKNNWQQLTRNLSAGQQRKTQLARLWLSQEKIWLLDEPFNALDAKSCAILSEKICQHSAAGGAVVLSTHQKIEINQTPKFWKL